MRVWCAVHATFFLCTILAFLLRATKSHAQSIEPTSTTEVFDETIQTDLATEPEAHAAAQDSTTADVVVRACFVFNLCLCACVVFYVSAV